MERKERLLEQVLKVRKLQRLEFYGRPEDIKLEIEIDLLKLYFGIYLGKLGFFHARQRGRLAGAFHEFESIQMNYHIEDGKPVPPPEVYSEQRIRTLNALIRLLV